MTGFENCSRQREIKQDGGSSLTCHKLELLHCRIVWIANGYQAASRLPDAWRINYRMDLHLTPILHCPEFKSHGRLLSRKFTWDVDAKQLGTNGLHHYLRFGLHTSILNGIQLERHMYMTRILRKKGIQDISEQAWFLCRSNASWISPCPVISQFLWRRPVSLTSRKQEFDSR
jgi:hypothetical protein